jgi:hypothetical protein
LATLLTNLASDDAHNGGVLATELPVTKLDTGGSPSYQLNAAGAAKLVQTNLRDSMPRTPQRAVQVAVQNGVGTPGLVPAACGRLRSAGLVPLDEGNATFTKHRSEILVPSRSVAAAQLGDRVAAALHLPDSDVAATPFGQNVASVVVILGVDFKP